MARAAAYAARTFAVDRSDIVTSEALDPQLKSDPVAAFVHGVNGRNHPELISAFASDATVNDQLVEYSGVDEIEAWIEADIFKDAIRIDPIGETSRYDNVILVAEVDGTFDKTFLPKPLILTFYFNLRDNLIVQLIILRNQPRDGLARRRDGRSH